MTRWWRRALVAALAAAAVYGGGTAAHYDPDPLRVVLLAALGAVVLGVLLDSLADRGDPWGDDAVRETSTRGHDRATAAHLRALEDHLAARRPTGQVRDRLATLADQALRSGHGVDRHTPEGRALLGADVVEVLDGPPRRLSVAGLRRCLERIEAL